MINDAIKSALKITIPSLSSEPKSTQGGSSASRKSPPTTSSDPSKTHHNNNSNGQSQVSPLRPKQNSPNQRKHSLSPPSLATSTSITNVLSHLHAAKKEAMMKSTTTANKIPGNSNHKMAPPSNSRSARQASAPSLGVISELDKTKYTLGKWVDTIIVQMNDPSIDDIELDDSIKKSNFNNSNVAKEKEDNEGAKTSPQSPTVHSITEPKPTKTAEFEYIDDEDNEDEVASEG